MRALAPCSREAEETVLVEAFPGPIQELRADLQQAAQSGLSVAGMVLRPEDRIEGTNIRVSNLAQRVLEIWRCDQLTLIVDARQFMLALFDDKTGELRRGIWVSSPYLAPVFNNGIVADVIMHTHEMFKESAAPTSCCSGATRPRSGTSSAFPTNDRIRSKLTDSIRSRCIRRDRPAVRREKQHPPKKPARGRTAQASGPPSI